MSFQRQELVQSATQAMLSDVVKWAETNGEKYDAICELRKIPTRLGLVDDDLAVLPADMRHFERKVATAPYGSVSRAKDLEAAMKRGNARIRALLNRFHAANGSSRLQTGRDKWDLLIEWVKGREGFVDRGALFSTGASFGLVTLRARCAVAPGLLTQPEADRILRDATSEKRRSVRKGLRFLNRLIAEFSTTIDLIGLLPIAPVQCGSGSDRATRILWGSLSSELRTSAEKAMASAVAGPKERFAEAMEQIKAGGDPETVLAELNDMGTGRRKPPENTQTAKAGYRQAITWLVRAAEAQGHSRDQIMNLETLMTLQMIQAACNQQIQRTTESDELKDPKNSQSLGKRLRDIRTIARHGMARADLVAVIDLVKQAQADYVLAPGAKYSDEADAVCKQIQRSPHLAANFVNAPKVIAEQAERLLADAQARDCQRDELSALRLYATAVAFCVQVSRPVRTSNLIRLRHRATLEHPGNLEWVTDKTHAVLRFQKSEVKNKVYISVHLEGREAGILWKWLKEYRARFVDLRGIEDSAYVIPGEALPRLQKRGSKLPVGCVTPGTMSEMWDVGARIIGVNLTAHQARHAVATLILALEPGNFAKVSSVLSNTEEIARKHYGRDSGEQAARAVRAALKAKHPGIFRTLQKGAGA